MCSDGGPTGGACMDSLPLAQMHIASLVGVPELELVMEDEGTPFPYNQSWVAMRGIRGRIGHDGMAMVAFDDPHSFESLKDDSELPLPWSAHFEFHPRRTPSRLFVIGSNGQRYSIAGYFTEGTIPNGMSSVARRFAQEPIATNAKIRIVTPINRPNWFDPGVTMRLRRSVPVSPAPEEGSGREGEEGERLAGDGRARTGWTP